MWLMAACLSCALLHAGALVTFRFRSALIPGLSDQDLSIASAQLTAAAIALAA
jgi:hypothetical protein